MIPLAMIMLDKFMHGASEVTLAERDHPIEALLVDRSDKVFRIGIRWVRDAACAPGGVRRCHRISVSGVTIVAISRSACRPSW